MKVFNDASQVKRFVLGFLCGLVALPLLGVIAGRLGLLAVTATGAPSALETWFAHMALNARVAREAPLLKDPIAATEANLMAGERLFRDDCAGCHGTPSASSDVPPFVPLYPSPQQFALHHPHRPIHQLYWIVRNGVRYTGMFAWAKAFAPDSTGKDVSEQRIWTVVTFLSHLDSLPPKVDSEWHRKSEH